MEEFHRQEQKFAAGVLICKTVYWGRSWMFNIAFASSANVDLPQRNVMALVCYYVIMSMFIIIIIIIITLASMVSNTTSTTTDFQFNFVHCVIKISYTNPTFQDLSFSLVQYKGLQG